MKYKAGSLAALRVKDFRLFIVAQLVSLSGTWMQHVAVGWLVYDITKSPFSLGLAMTILSAPIMLFTLFGGIIADRYPKRNIIIVAQVLAIVPAFLLALLTHMHLIKMWHIFIIVFFIGLLNAFDIPARQSFLVEMVGKGNLLNAIALNSAAFNGARIIGPFFAGIIIAKINIHACFYINAASYLPVLFALFKISEKGVGAVSGHTSIIKELLDGLSYVKNHRQVYYIFITIGFISLFGIPYSSFLPVIAKDYLMTGAEGLGRLSGAAGAGAFTAALVIAVKGSIKNRFLYMSIAVSAASWGIFIMTISQTEVLSLILLFVTGFGIVSFLANANNFVQETVPNSIRGRVMSTYILVFLGMTPVGNLLIGSTADFIGTMNALRVASALCICVSIFFIKNKSLWNRNLQF